MPVAREASQVGLRADGGIESSLPSIGPEFTRDGGDAALQVVIELGDPTGGAKLTTPSGCGEGVGKSERRHPSKSGAGVGGRSGTSDVDVSGAGAGNDWTLKPKGVRN
jgi:hypothetical protein